MVGLTVMAYQAICFPVYKIPKVRRRDYLVFDRHHLAYLNVIEKVKETASKTAKNYAQAQQAAQPDMPGQPEQPEPFSADKTVAEIEARCRPLYERLRAHRLRA